jgi:hypothetical protein
MQIDIRIVPVYEGNFADCFSHIAELLDRIGYQTIRQKELSLYALVDRLEVAGIDPKVPADIREKLSPLLKKLVPLKEAAQECLLAKKLNELDQILYQIEDQFEDWEKSL